MDTPTTDIGPGLGAFVAFFLLAVLLWFLMRNMNARMRRMAYAERDRVARVDAEVLAAEAEADATGAAERGEGSTGQPTGTFAGPRDPTPPSAPPASTDPPESRAAPESTAPPASTAPGPSRQEPGTPSA